MVLLLRFLYLRFLKNIYGDKEAVLYKVYVFIAKVFVPSVLEAVLEATRKKHMQYPSLTVVLKTLATVFISLIDSTPPKIVPEKK